MRTQQSTTTFTDAIGRMRRWLRREVIGLEEVDAGDLRKRALAYFGADPGFVAAILREDFAAILADEARGPGPLLEAMGRLDQPEAVAKLRAEIRTGQAAGVPAHLRAEAFETFFLAHLDQEIVALRHAGHYEDPTSGRILSAEATSRLARERTAAAMAAPASPFYRPHGGTV